jgi:hypothetical protein
MAMHRIGNYRHHNHDNEVDFAAFRRFAMLQRQNHVHRGDAGLFGGVRQVVQIGLQGPREARFERIVVHGNMLSYGGVEDGRVGLYVASEPLNRERNYFEVEIVDAGEMGTVGVGLVPARYPLDSQPGWKSDSVGYHADDGKLFKSSSVGRHFGPECSTGDRIGCGINFGQVVNDDPHRQMVPVFFTRNGKEIGTVLTVMPPEGLMPAVGMHSEGEEVRLNLDARWDHSEVILMSIDSCEEDWSRLHDVRVNGQLLEYVGQGKNIGDVGLAQARHPLTTRYHYFELQIVDPGDNCYIAIGLARRNYPRHRHPGWNKGSIAYHADDGKIFVGCGVGEPFGPQCNKGDVMGCGVMFPRDYQRGWDVDEDDTQDGAALYDEHGDEFVRNDDDAQGGGGDMDAGIGAIAGGGFSSSDSEDEEWWARPNLENGTKVQVFFTRNGKTVGKRDVRIPKGGFFPTVGMLSSDEKVRVDLRPLTG